LNDRVVAAPEQTFDFVVVGGGSAGCVLANRLSADPRTSVALIEAGGRDNWIWFHVPVGYLFAIGNPRAAWMLKTEPVPGLNGRVLNYPRGRVLGGCSAINAMIYMRGQAADHDGWREMGLAGWGWDDVEPVFRSHEDHYLGKSRHHGAGGEWRVDAPRMRWDILDAFAEAAQATGIPKTQDFNTGDNEGVAYFQVNQKNGRRWSAARGFLKPVLERPNLSVIPETVATTILVEDGRAVGIAGAREGEVIVIRARREVVLAAGAVATPHLLQLSGIGPGAHLRALGIPVRASAP
jgi:choline dehydrogenase